MNQNRSPSKRRRWQFSLLTLFVVMTVVAILCVIAPHVDRVDVITVIVTSPFLLFLIWCFKDVLCDFGLLKNPNAAVRSWERPEECNVPKEVSIDSDTAPRSKKARRVIGWWHPRGGYRGWL